LHPVASKDLDSIQEISGRIEGVTATRAGRSPAYTTAVASGRIDDFAGDLPEHEKKLVWATQGVPKPDLFEAKVGGTAWKSKPSWLHRRKKRPHGFIPIWSASSPSVWAQTTYEVESSHVPMLSQPKFVIDVIRTAASA